MLTHICRRKPVSTHFRLDLGARGVQLSWHTAGALLPTGLVSLGAEDPGREQERGLLCTLFQDVL